MAKTRTSSGKAKASREVKRPTLLNKLQPGEAALVLPRLLAGHPELLPEAEEISRSTLGDVSFESIASEVEDSIRQFDLDDLNGRAGRHSWGYTEPTEAAWELLEEAVEPFVEDMKRHLGLGLDAEAFEICKGIVLGLYQCRDSSEDEFFWLGIRFPRRGSRQGCGRLDWRGQTGRFRQPAWGQSHAHASEICGQTRSRVAMDLQTGCWQEGQLNRPVAPNPVLRCRAGRSGPRFLLPLQLRLSRLYTLVYTLAMRDLSITEFRRQCLSLLEHLPEEGIVITKRGQPVARVAPVRPVGKGERVTLPLLKGKGRPGPLCPSTETPYDLVLD
jgi:antitoxin (DNA-binding transcriptional repressor) of toxin-antitoxin stability system